MSNTKGITIWEQYVEYLVLGIAVVAALAFTAMQFIGQPNAIERAPQGRITPGQIDGLLVAEANRINLLLSSTSAENIPDPEPLLPVFDRTLNASTNPAPRIGHLHAHVPPRIGEWSRPEVTYHVPQPPPPREIVAAQYHDTLADEAIEQYGLAELFPTQPYDLSWVSAAGVLNTDEMLEQFKAGNPDGNPAPIPPSWYFGDRVVVVNLVTERQQRNGDGTWSEPKRLDPIPGQFHARDLLAGEVESSRRDEIIRMVRDEEAQNRLLQPPFYPTKSGAWSPPDPFIEAGADEPDGMAKIRSLARQKQRAERLRDDLIRRIERMEREGGGGGGSEPGGRGGGGGGFGGGAGIGVGGGYPMASVDWGGGFAGSSGPWNSGSSGAFFARGGGGGPGGGGGGSGETGGGGRGTGGGGSGPDPGGIDRLRQRLAEVEQEIDGLRREIARLMPAGGVMPTAPEGEVIFWAHDLNVESGQTYRYRFIIEVYNPFCARKLNLLEEQHHLAERYVLATEPSEWSQPITIEPPVQMFVVEAHPPRQHRAPGLARPLGSTAIEIWRFYDGQWHQRRIIIEPGERISAAGPDGRGDDPVGIDFMTDWYVLDIVPDRDATASDFRASRVILQNVRTNEIEERHPLVDIPLRDELRSRARRLAGRM